MMKIKKWIGIDLDGTLAKQVKGSQEIGKPIQSMVDLISNILDDGEYTVKIFTSRAEAEEQKNKVKDWLKENSLPDLAITNVKDSNCVLLLDNLAARVIFNKGEICNDCLEHINSRFNNKFSGGYSPFYRKESKSDF